MYKKWRLGGRADWNMNENQSHRFGLVTPRGVEAFPSRFKTPDYFLRQHLFLLGQTMDMKTSVSEPLLE